MPIFAGTVDGAAIAWIARLVDWVQSRPVEMAADGLSIGARHHKVEQPI